MPVHRTHTCLCVFDNLGKQYVKTTVFQPMSRFCVDMREESQHKKYQHVRVRREGRRRGKKDRKYLLFPPQPEFFMAGGNFLCLSPDQKPGPFTANWRCVCHPCPCPRLSACPAPSLSPQPLALLTWGSWPPVVSRPSSSLHMATSSSLRLWVLPPWLGFRASSLEHLAPPSPG